MKFAIYGDSFAESSPCMYPNPELDALAWTTLLAQRLGATSIDYYALGGSSLFYSYQRMLDTADQYDRSIIAVSDPNRYTKSIAGQLFNVPPSKRNTRYPGVSSYTLKNLNGWFASLDDDFMNTAQELMIRDIESRWPNAVIVPCFPTSFTTARAARWNNFSLLDINLLMLDQLNLELDHGFSELPSATGILCHMPVEWHRSVAYLIYAFLQTGRIKVPRLQLMHGVDNYYTSS